MIDGGEKIAPGPAAADPVSDLQRFGSVALALQSVAVPGGQGPVARDALPLVPALLAAAGPVVAKPGAGAVPTAPAFGPTLVGAVVLLAALPEALLPDVWAMTLAGQPSSKAVARVGIVLVFAGSHVGVTWA
jgi:hypothetical protein